MNLYAYVYEILYELLILYTVIDPTRAGDVEIVASADVRWPDRDGVVLTRFILRKVRNEWKIVDDRREVISLEERRNWSSSKPDG